MHIFPFPQKEKVYKQWPYCEVDKEEYQQDN